jgi:hypothetical protein
MRNTREASDVFAGNRVCQFSHPFSAASTAQRATVKHRHTARVITAILKTA